ncbi:microfibril-associated glycoprotein 4-like isoform X2 [Drosophila virilis]|nr:fibrinogen-like protein 1 [Drosophila virilis]
MEETIRDKQMQLEMQIELNNIHKKNAAITKVLLNEKNRQLLELQDQIERYKQEKNLESLDKSLNGQAVQSEVLFKNKNSLNLISTEKCLHSKDNSLDDKREKVVKNLETISTLHSMDKYLSSNCLDKSNDIYLLKVPGLEPFPVLCDSTLAGSGWTVVQRRKDGTENFNRNWQDYRAGFGDLRGEFFMGLEILHRMTKAQSHELFIHLEDFHNETRYAHYNNFVIGSEHESYKIESLGEYSGNADDALLQHKNCKFSTPDRPVAGKSNCAVLYQSGWWFNGGCYLCNLNGQYITQNIENPNAIEWRTWHFRPLKFVQMMIRPTK